MSSWQKFRNLPYKPGQKTVYKISRSKIDLYVQCPRCFWLDTRLKISRPKGPPFTLNSAVDTLLKQEFDIHRASGKQHPLQEAYGIDCKPVPHEKLNTWRQNFTGVQAHHEPTNLLIFGAIDDLWQDKAGKFVVVDYKSTIKAGKIEELGNETWHDQYRRQLEIYQWLLRQNGLPVSNTGYWVYCNAKKDNRAFDAKLEFELTLLSYKGKDDWVEPTLQKIKDCLESDMPKESADCEHCAYAKSRTQLTLEALQSKPKKLYSDT